MPKTLHAELARRSDADGVSLNQYIVSALARTVSPGGDAAEQPEGERRPLPRTVRNALVANAIVVALATATAITLLIVTWR